MRLARFVIGHTLPRGARVKSVRLDGRRAEYRTRMTNRGQEILVRAPCERQARARRQDALAAIIPARCPVTWSAP